MIYYELLLILFLSHFIGDFLLQPRKMAINKSNLAKPIYLLRHTFTIWITAYIPLIFFTHHTDAMEISLLIAMLHGVIDSCSWNFYKVSVRKRTITETQYHNFKYYEDHWFYVTIGADQLLHSLTIIFVLYNVSVG